MAALGFQPGRRDCRDEITIDEPEPVSLLHLNENCISSPIIGIGMLQEGRTLLYSYKNLAKVHIITVDRPRNMADLKQACNLVGRILTRQKERTVLQRIQESLL